MKNGLLSKRINWEEFGFQTILSSNDEREAMEICDLHLRAYQDQLRPEVARIDSEIEHSRNRASALHSHLYDRPVPVNDASMLTHSLQERILLGLCLLMAGACFAGNVTSFLLFGWSVGLAVLVALGITALPLGIGHLAYEKIVSDRWALQTGLIIVMTALGSAGLYELGQARRAVMDRAASESVTNSYVDGGAADDSPGVLNEQGNGESKVKGSFGEAAFLIAMAAELAVGLLMGLFIKMRTDEDYAAWRKLKEILKQTVELQEKLAELLLRVEIAKKQCMAGIRRGQDVRNRRRPPYHKVLALFVLCVLLHVPAAHSQTTEHYEGILIDTSTSIAKRGRTQDLFQEYLRSAKVLLATEPPNSRVWVSSIASDSFGGVREMVSGWTPDARGIFTDDLNRARRQLAVTFEGKSSNLAPNAQGTDIFGALWHVKTLFESIPDSEKSDGVSKTIWIFSDMMNEVPKFPMPQLLVIGPERMLERAKANGLVVPLPHYTIGIYGASLTGLTPQSWTTMKRFWEMYFAAAGAQLVSYSAECETRR